MFRIEGPGESAYAIDPMSNYPPENTWTIYEIALDEAQRSIESGTWAEILANITSLRINAEFVGGDEEVGGGEIVVMDAGRRGCTRETAGATDPSVERTGMKKQRGKKMKID